jgi:hypothetical protein
MPPGNLIARPTRHHNVKVEITFGCAFWSIPLCSRSPELARVKDQEHKKDVPEVGNSAGKRLDGTVFGKDASKPLAKRPSEDFPRKEEALEPVEAQGLYLVAGAGFEPATFGL